MAGATIGDMLVEPPLELRLESAKGAERTGGRICGRLRDEQGVEHDFVTWLELLVLLEDARVRAGSRSHHDSRRTR